MIVEYSPRSPPGPDGTYVSPCQTVVAGEGAADGLHARVADPERVVDGWSRVEFPVVGEDQEVGPARPVLRPRVLDHRWQYCLHAGSVQLLAPEAEIGRVKRASRLRG